MKMTDSTESFKDFINHLPEVKKYIAELEHQDLWWTTVAMVGKINNENIDPQLLESIVETQEEFQGLRDVMIEALIGRYLNRVNSEIALKAQAAIDILIRNLFERTADVGFLATDDDLVEFMAKEVVSEEDQQFIYQRIEEYVAKYTVYDDVLLLDVNGAVKAKLDLENPVVSSSDEVIYRTISTTEEYVEVYRYSDLFPNKKASHIFAKKIEGVIDGQKKTVGVLCLSFNFNDEMSRIYESLYQGQEGYGIALLNEAGRTISSNNTKSVEVGRQVIQPTHMQQPIHENQKLIYSTKTHGYQGYVGLPWYGYIQVSGQVAFSDKERDQDLGVIFGKDSPIYLSELEEMNIKVSTLLLTVILNGKILSIKRDVKSFLPVLDSFQNISVDIQAIFERFIDHIHTILIRTIQDKVAFSASLASSVMDRNLYERANDCRWWALNSSFRKFLTAYQKQPTISAESSERLMAILAYINELYTVYTNIILYDTQGHILAVSNENETGLIGSVIPRPNDTKRCQSLSDTQAHAVSDFHQSTLYGDEYTYIYHAAVKSWENENLNVGGIALVFDSKPEFEAMLKETEPQYAHPYANETTFSLFVDRAGRVLSSTNPTFEIGQQLKLNEQILKAENGQNSTIDCQWEEQNYLIGYKVSTGYREYKNGDGYQNDVITMVLTGI